MIALPLVVFLLFIAAVCVGLRCLLSSDANTPDTALSLYVALLVRPMTRSQMAFAGMARTVANANTALEAFNSAYAKIAKQARSSRS